MLLPELANLEKAIGTERNKRAKGMIVDAARELRSKAEKELVNSKQEKADYEALITESGRIQATKSEPRVIQESNRAAQECAGGQSGLASQGISGSSVASFELGEYYSNAPIRLQEKLTPTGKMKRHFEDAAEQAKKAFEQAKNATPNAVSIDLIRVLEAEGTAHEYLAHRQSRSGEPLPEGSEGV